MCDNNKTFQCPVCVRGKYKECSLIQHLIDKHPDFPATQKIRNDYQFPMACTLCSQKITTPIALMTHYSVYHPQEYQSLKVLLGFDFNNSESTFNSSDSLDIIPKLEPIKVHILQNEKNLLQELYTLIYNSPIMHSTLKSSDVFAICCSKGIVLIDVKTKGLSDFLDHYVKGKVPIIEYNTPNESMKNAKIYGISIPTNVKTDPFICQNYTQYVRAYGPPITNNEDKPIDIHKKIPKVDLRLALVNIAIAYHYLISLGFFPSCDDLTKKSHEIDEKKAFKCPCCELAASSILSIYRHLFRLHPFPTLIMNQFKMAEQSKGVFVCDACHDKNLSSFDDLIIHVYEHHREDLLKKTIAYLNAHEKIKDTYPDLESFLQLEYKNIVC